MKSEQANKELLSMMSLTVKMRSCAKATNGKFYVYGILCKDGSIYIGSSCDIVNRLADHFTEKNSRVKDAIKIIYLREYQTLKEARKEEITTMKLISPKQFEKERSIGEFKKRKEAPHHFRRTATTKH